MLMSLVAPWKVIYAHGHRMSFAKLFNANIRAIGMSPKLARNIVVGCVVVGLITLAIGFKATPTHQVPQARLSARNPEGVQGKSLTSE